jgi:hypothetical protein
MREGKLNCHAFVKEEGSIAPLLCTNQFGMNETLKASFKKAGAACLAAGLVSTWDGGTANAAQSFSGEITPTHDLTAVYFLFASGPCTPAYSRKISDFVAANTTTDFYITFNSFGLDSYVGDRFAIVALYDTVNGGVSLGFDPAAATDILATSPAPDFNGPWTIGYGSFDRYYNAGGVEEAIVAAALQTGSYNGESLDDSHSGGLQIDPNSSVRFWIPGEPKYFSQISTDPLAPAAFTLINFSGASAGGSGFVVEVVPEPATISFLATGASLLSFGWLRRRK